MNLYKLYQLEKYGRIVKENEHGFISYRLFDDSSLYIETLYIKPESRGSGKAQDLEKLVIQEENPKVIICDIDINSNNCEEPLSKFLHCGYKILKCNSERITLYKKVKNE